MFISLYPFSTFGKGGAKLFSTFGKGRKRIGKGFCSTFSKSGLKKKLIIL